MQFLRADSEGFSPPWTPSFSALSRRGPAAWSGVDFGVCFWCGGGGGGVGLLSEEFEDLHPGGRWVKVDGCVKIGEAKMDFGLCWHPP